MSNGSDSATLVAATLQAIRAVLPARERMALHEPEFAGHEWEYLKECIDTGWVSYLGGFVQRFDHDLAAVTEVGHAVAVCNGTVALQLCLHVLGVGDGDEVLAPTLTFVGTANAIHHCRATPHFVDSEVQSLGIDVPKLAAYLDDVARANGDGCINRHTGRRIAAVVPVHVFGHPMDMDPLVELCDRYGIAIVEDAAESLGSYYKGRHTGGRGRLAALSFNGNKVVTTGGGGAVLTDDAGLAERVRHLSTTARVGAGFFFEHDEAGFNFRLPNLNAALGCAQLERLPDMVRRKRLLAERYAQALEGIDGVAFVREPPQTRSNYWLNAILVPGTPARDALLEASNAQGIMTRPAWTLMHRLVMYEGCPRMDLSVAEDLAARLVNLPSSPALVEEGA